jgi:hypothetical protein
MFKILTGYEIVSLPETYNLTDGHAFRRWFAAEEAIIDRSAHFFTMSNRGQQVESERENVQGFSRLAKHTCDGDALGYFMCFTESIAPIPVASPTRGGREGRGRF